jgi:hypothetical protein
VRRELARKENWKVVPKHPLASGRIELLDYAAGLASVDWELMESRDYSDQNCKATCMAECLAPSCVPVGAFFRIYVPSASVADHIRKLFGHDLVSENANMFAARRR